MSIGGIKVPTPPQAEEVLKEVPQEKRQYQQLQLLPEVDALVIHENGIPLELSAFNEDEGPYCNPIEALRKHIFIYYHEHVYKIRNAIFVV